MNVKRLFGAILTILGVASLITAAIMFNNSKVEHEIKALITYSILGLIFFVSGIGLVKSTKDEV
jgi:hypothetical protein